MERILKRLLALQIRKRRRFRAPPGICVVMSGQMGLGRNQVYDIGMGGLSFFYVFNGELTDRANQTLTISMAGRPAVTQIPCKTVSDFDTGELVFAKQRVKRRCVRFDRLTEEQKAQVRALLKKHVIMQRSG